MAKYLTLDLLALFKTKQDAANENKFMETENYVDANGKIKADAVQNNSVIPIHVVTENSQTKYFTDNAGVKTSTEVTGEIGKLYIDLESGGKCLYTYNTTDGFIPFASSIATESDIDELFN